MESENETRSKFLERIGAISYDVEAMQKSFDALAQKVKAINEEFAAIDESCLERSGNQYAPSDDDGKQGPGFTRSCSVRVPAFLCDRWNSKEAPKLRQKSKTIVGPKRAKPVRWDGRWQDLFDSNEQEMNDEEVVSRKSTGKARITTRGQMFMSDNSEANHHYCIINPHGLFRVFWDIVGLIMIFYDVVAIPVNTAWGFDLGTTGIALLAIGSAYWSIDIFLGFNTAYFKEATLICSRKAVAMHYLQTWLLPDVFLLTLDVALLVSSDGVGHMFRSIRSVRLLRIVRGLRLFKLSHVFLALEYYLNIYGGNTAVLVISITKTLGSVYLLVHLACCMWYYLGREHVRSDDTWLDLVANPDGASFLDLYTRSCHWVLGHLTGNEVDQTIAPQNLAERAFTLILIMSSLLIVGIAISNMSNTVARLQRANAEAYDTKRTLQAYLHAQRFPTDMSISIVRHALEVHKKRKEMSLDPFILGLLSTSLVSSINAWQRSKYLLKHPLFNLLAERHPEAIHGIYSACVPAIYADNDIVYRIGTLSDVLYISVAGSYALHYYPDLSEATIVTVYEDTQFFCEVSLFAQLRHRSTLNALTFADSLSLHGADFIQCIRLLPNCIGTMYRYARLYLSKLVEVQPLLPDIPPSTLKEGEIAVQDVMPSILAQEACDMASGLHLPQLFEVVIPSVEPDTVHDAIDCIIDQDLPAQEIVRHLELAFPEVRETDGLYSLMDEPLERKRSIGAMLGLIWLYKNSYSKFTECQKEETRMGHKLWEEWQHFVRWTDMSREILHTLMIMLCIRGFGKVRSLVKMVPPTWRSPENTVHYLMKFAPQAVPSVNHLSQDNFALIEKVLETHKEFNLAQLMQGENTPYQVWSLKECINVEGEELLKFYLLCLVGMMCGLTGTVTIQGCLFMDESNGRNVLSCIECLRRLKRAQPHAVYWSYISGRAELLGLRVSNPEELTIARLTCLLRASVSDGIALQQLWSQLNGSDKNILVKHFLADGIHDRGFLLSFLPGYLANAKNNPAVGLYRGIIVLVDLIVLLKSDGVVNHKDEQMTVVNFTDVANYTKETVSSLAFESLPEHTKMLPMNGEVRVTVIAKHWQASSNQGWRPDPMHEIAREVKRMSRVTRSVPVNQAGASSTSSSSHATRTSPSRSVYAV